METCKRISDLAPQDQAVVERLFGQPPGAAADMVLVLRSTEQVSVPGKPVIAVSDELPAWCNVLEGFTDDDLAEFQAILKTPIRLARDE